MCGLAVSGIFCPKKPFPLKKGLGNKGKGMPLNDVPGKVSGKGGKENEVLGQIVSYLISNVSAFDRGWLRRQLAKQVRVLQPGVSSQGVHRDG